MFHLQTQRPPQTAGLVQQVTGWTEILSVSIKTLQGRLKFAHVHSTEKSKKNILNINSL